MTAQANTSRRGMTLIELMVGVGVLAILIMAASMIMAKAREVVVKSQSLIRINAEAAAVADTLRSDLQSITQFGVLCITQDASGQPVLVYSLGTPSSPVSSGTGQSTSQLVGVGLCPVLDPSGNPSRVKIDDQGTLLDVKSLWRMGYLLTPSGTSPQVAGHDFAEMQNLSRSVLDGYVGQMISSYGLATPGIHLPFNSIADTTDTWKVLATHCSELSILWTDGSTDANGLKWFGLTPAGPLPGNWSTLNVNSTDTSGQPVAEYTSGNGAYRAMWSVHNLAAWPKAIKIHFKLTDTAGGLPSPQTEYEIICAIGGATKEYNP